MALKKVYFRHNGQLIGVIDTATADVVETIRVNLASVYRCEPKDIEIDFTGFTDNKEWNYTKTDMLVGRHGPEFSGVRPIMMSKGVMPLDYLFALLHGEIPDFSHDELTLFV